jgi:GT2 family glycosyltransferase
VTGDAVPDVTVVVTTYNRADALRDAVASLFRQETRGGFRFEILIVDNASTDGTAGVAAGLAAEAPVLVRCVREERRGVACARNRGVAESRGRWVAFFDDDQLAAPAWLGSLVETALQRGAPVVGGRVVLRLPAGASGRLGPVCCRLLGESSEAATPHPYLGKTLPGTGNALVERRVFEEVGAFDEGLTSGCEDTDFFRRVRRNGIPCWYAPGAVVDHVIPEHRLRRDYFTWVSLRQGANYALLDSTAHGRARLAGTCFARVGQALAITLPRWLGRVVTGGRAATLDQECLLWRMNGYVRRSLQILMPGTFRQRRFFDHLDFRSERTDLVDPG